MRYNAQSIRQHQAARLLDADFKKTRKNILGDGLKLCRRAKAFNSVDKDNAYIAVVRTPHGDVAKMQDVAHCGNAHLCAFCAGLKASKMRSWIDEVFKPALTNHNLVAGLLTLTAHHKRDCSWDEFVNNFYSALADFAKNMRRDLAKIGSYGRIRATEAPVGSNGLHLHIHDLFTYAHGADIAAFTVTALEKWKAALRKHGLRCSRRGVDVKADGDFDIHYIAKELAAHDTKTDSKSDLVSMFTLLDRSARGNQHAGQDWIRAAKAIQGRDRYNVGQLAKKLGIPSPSDWKRKQCVSSDTTIVSSITYPQSHHMLATSPANERAGLAFILRAARNELARPGCTQKMVFRMCAETIKCETAAIQTKITLALAKELTHADRHSANLAEFETERRRLGMLYRGRYTFALERYYDNTFTYLYTSPKPEPEPAPALALPLALDLDLDFT